MQVASLGFFWFLLSPAAVAEPAIYRCADAAGVVYSDRPCGAEADRYEIDASRVSVYTPVPTAERASTPAPPAKAVRSNDPPAQSRRAKSGRVAAGRGADPARHRLECAKLDQDLREVRSKMRGGYGVEEGERLKARQRRLAEQRRTRKCG